MRPITGTTPELLMGENAWAFSPLSGPENDLTGRVHQRCYHVHCLLSQRPDCHDIRVDASEGPAPSVHDLSSVGA